MKAFSIGRVDLPWVNMIPPVQADVPALPGQTPCSDEKKPAEKALGPCKLTSNGRKSASPSPGAIEEQLTKEGFTAAMEERERQDDIRSIPSLDLAQQLELRDKYQALHQRVKDEGLYDCPYIEYGKECARYAFLFGMFLYLVSIGWYLTSALFLGGFWVSSFFVASRAP